jgi:hypothetical protein
VALEVVDPDERLAVNPGQRLGGVDPDEERPGEARSVGDGDRIDVGDGGSGVGEGGIEDGQDPAEVGPRRDLRNDPAGRGGHLATTLA